MKIIIIIIIIIIFKWSKIETTNVHTTLSCQEFFLAIWKVEWGPFHSRGYGVAHLGLFLLKVFFVSCVFEVKITTKKMKHVPKLRMYILHMSKNSNYFLLSINEKLSILLDQYIMTRCLARRHMCICPFCNLQIFKVV
jgi:hypothetical protein